MEPPNDPQTIKLGLNQWNGDKTAVQLNTFTFRVVCGDETVNEHTTTAGQLVINCNKTTLKLQLHCG